MKKSNFKQLLTATSVLALVTGISTNASATTFTTTAVAASSTKDSNATGVDVAAEFATNDTLKFGGTHTFTTDANAYTGITFDVNGATDPAVVAGDDLGIAAFTNSVDGSATVASLTAADGATITLDGTDFSGLGDITLNGANGGTLAIEESMTLSGAITNATADKSVLTVAAGKTAVFKGVVGATKFKTTTLTGKATFEDALSSTDIAVAATANFRGAVAGDIASSGEDATVNIGTDAENTADLTGGLDLSNGGTAVVYGDISGSVTAADATNDIAITGDVAGTLSVTAADAQATVTGDVGTNVALNNGAVATVTGDITGTTTLTAEGDQLTLGEGTSTGAVDNSGTIYVTGDRTFANANGADANTAGTLGSVEVQEADTGLTFSVAHGLSGGVLTTDQTTPTNDITVSADQTLDATTSIGTADNPFRNIVISGDHDIRLGSADIYAGAATKTDGEGVLKFNTADISLRSVGAEDAKLKTVNFEADGAITNGLYVSSLNIINDATATIGGVVDVGAVYTENDETIIFSDGVSFVDGCIMSTDFAGHGAIEFAGGAVTGNTVFADNGSAFASVTFADVEKKLAKVGGNIYATAININAGGVQLTDDVTFQGATSLEGLLDVQNYTLTHTGNVTLDGDSALVVKLSSDNDNALTGGTIDITGKLDSVGEIQKLKLQIDDRLVDRKHGGGRTYTLITASVAASNLTADNIIVAEKQRGAANYTVTIDENNAIILTEVDQTAAYVKGRVPARFAGLIDKIAGSASGSTFSKIADILESSGISGNGTKLKEIAHRLQDGSVLAPQTFTEPLGDIGANIDARVDSLEAPVVRNTASNDKISGIAAGDDAARFGAWASPFYSRLNQKERNDFSGYRNEAYGLGIGLDTKVTENLTVGASVSASHSSIKHKDTKDGDTTKVDTVSFSLYHTYALTDNWYMSGTATFANNEVDNRSKRVVAAGYETAAGKYSVNAFDIKEMFGYKYAMDSVTVTPMIGAKYTRVFDASYTESGTTAQNLYVTTKAFDKVEAIAGARVSGNAYSLNEMSVTPEAHAFVNYDLLNKSQKQSVSLAGDGLDAATDKAARLKYNLGLSVNSVYGSMEYGAGYDLQLADKRVGHQGSLKVRVNF